MVIYNTTYRIGKEDSDNFLVYLHEVYLPEAVKSGLVGNARMMRVLSHRDEDSDCFCVQFEVADSAVLHRWFLDVGERLYAELCRAFKERVVGFSTLMEVID